MTPSTALSFALLLKGQDRVEGMLSLLDENKVAALRAQLPSLAALSPAEIRTLWNAERDLVAKTFLESAQLKLGLNHGHLPLALENWLIQRSNAL